MVNTTYNSTQEMIDKLQQFKCNTKLKFYKNINNYYDDINFTRRSGNFQFEEDHVSIYFQGIGRLYHEVLLLMKLLQTKPQVRNMNINYYDFYYTVIKNRYEKEIVDDKKEN